MKNAAAIICLLVCLTLALPADAAESTDIFVEEHGAVSVLTARRGTHTLVLAGPADALTNENALLVLDAFERGEGVTLTHPGFVDAEKASNLVWGGLPGENGEWAVNDSVRDADPEWGDKFLCWAASASDMLTLSGWKDRASEPFEDEDALFSLFIRSFYNDGGYQRDGIFWFFNGSDDGMTYPREPGQGFIPGTDPRDVCRFYSLDSDHSEYVSLPAAEEAITGLRDGCAVGINVTLCAESFSPRGAEEFFYDREGNGEKMFSSEECGEHLYSYDENGTVVLRDNEEPDRSMIRGLLCFDAEDGHYYPAEEFMDSFCYMRPVHIDPSLLDLTRPLRTLSVGNGGHALTVNGYIQGPDGIEALMITDSDDDAGYWLPPEGLERRQDRPDRCTLYLTRPQRLDEGNQTLMLLSYAGADALLCNVTVLSPAPTAP